MLKWVMMLLAFGLVAGCLGAMGVGATTMGKLLLALCSMTIVSLLIAWPFLRETGRRQNYIGKGQEAATAYLSKP
ncbi:MAG TPA: hypothetical protein VG146_16435 [Verrucomicrobiae bacterium]|nr:hypothetical protein [Verrucomicrobiae bacterium]